MKRTLVCLIGVFIPFLLIHGYAFPDNPLPQKGSRLPEIKLAVPNAPAQRDYLGLTGDGLFTIADIKAKVVIIEIFSMYCPHCQREAPSVNQLYRTIENNPDAKGTVKLLGIGAGNDSFEVTYFSKTYQVPFPLFEDKDYVIHEQLGKPATPFFIGVRINTQGSHEVFYTHLGGFEQADQFLDEILKGSGLQ